MLVMFYPIAIWNYSNHFRVREGGGFCCENYNRFVRFRIVYYRHFRILIVRCIAVLFWQTIQNT